MLPVSERSWLFSVRPWCPHLQDTFSALIWPSNKGTQTKWALLRGLAVCGCQNASLEQRPQEMDSYSIVSHFVALCAIQSPLGRQIEFPQLDCGGVGFHQVC